MNALLVLTLSAVFAVSLADIGPFTDSDLEFFKKLVFDELPRQLQIAIRKSGRSGGDNSNWCCINDKPIKSIPHTRIKMDTIKVETTVKVGYTHCGVFGANRCPLYDVRYTTEPKYSVETYEVPDQSQCDERDIKCCHGYIQIAGACLGLDEAAQYKDALADLKDHGLLDLLG